MLFLKYMYYKVVIKERVYIEYLEEIFRSINFFFIYEWLRCMLDFLL
jgi:hypothetical protein